MPHGIACALTKPVKPMAMAIRLPVPPHNEWCVPRSPGRLAAKGAYQPARAQDGNKGGV